MEIEEMKAVWADLSAQVEKQKKLTDQLILAMTEQRYRRGLNKIRMPELAGTIVCFAIVLFILLRLERFGNGYVLVCALFSVAYLLVMPLLSLHALYRMSALPAIDSSCRELLAWYAAGRKQFMTVQKASLYLGAVFLFAFLPVSLRLMNGRGSEPGFSTWAWFSLIALAFYSIIARYVYRYYGATVSKLERLLSDLEDDN